MAKKRANGEGSIRKKPSGRWEGRYTQGIDPVTGRAIQKSVSAKTQAESPIVDRWNLYMDDVLELEMDPVTGAQPKMQCMFLME